MSAATAAVLLAGVAGLLWPGRGALAARRLAGGARPRLAAPAASAPPWAAWASRLRRRAPAAVAVAVGWLVLAGHGSLAVALTALGVAALLPAHRRAVAAERDQHRLALALPPVADLLATCLVAGLPAGAAVRTVADAADGPAQVALRPVAVALGLGVDPAVAWAPLLRRGGAAARLARAFVRADTTGAPLASTVAALADDERERMRAAAESAARKAGVRAVAPLAVCFLPAFVLVGVVPLVAAAAGDVLTSLR